MSSFALKMIAVAAMVIDHINKAIPLQLVLKTWWGIPAPVSVAINTGMVALGRLSFPLFAFCIAEGCAKTKDFKRYLSRLLFFAFISEIPYQLCLEGATDLRIQFHNVLFTLFLGALSIYIYEKLTERKVNQAASCIFPVLICSLAGFVLDTDYMGFGVILVFIAYIIKDPKRKSLAMFLFLTLFYLGYARHHNIFNIEMRAILSWLSACGSLILIKFYNGERGPNAKYFFYWFYPVHLILIVLVGNYIKLGL